jgi:hypothetical protein
LPQVLATGAQDREAGADSRNCRNPQVQRVVGVEAMDSRGAKWSESAELMIKTVPATGSWNSGPARRPWKRGPNIASRK